MTCRPRPVRPLLVYPLVAPVLLVPLLGACGGGNSSPESVVLPTATAQQVSSAERCNTAFLSPAMPAGATLTSAVPTATPVPHCRVRGTITTTDPGPNTIRFSLAMPDQSNGRYLYDAPGGSAGSVSEPSATLLSQGFTIATGDQGTRPSFGLDYSWRNDPAQLVDYNYRGVHVTAQLTQGLSRAYYRAQPVRYLMGCSGGGRTGRNNARIYGTEDFEGVLIGAAPSFASNAIPHGRVAQYINQHPASWIPPDLLLAGERKIIETYDGVDGAVDGVIQDERLFDFDSSILLQVGFTQEQVKLIDFMRASYPHLGDPKPTLNDGRMPGYNISKLGEFTAWVIGSAPPPWTLSGPGAPAGFNAFASTINALYGPGYNWINFDFSNPVDYQRFTVGAGDNAGAAGYDYSRFAQGRGRLIVYAGTGDPAVPPKDGLVTRNEMTRYTPDLDSWSRHYFIPGWGHCGPSGGPGPQASEVTGTLLKNLTDWVEKGAAPTAVNVNRAAAGALPQRTFLICPEPSVAIFKGGDFNLAQNWQCQRPELRPL